jgi:hypothetical protein
MIGWLEAFRQRGLIAWTPEGTTIAVVRSVLGAATPAP